MAISSQKTKWLLEPLTAPTTSGVRSHVPVPVPMSESQGEDRSDPHPSWLDPTKWEPSKSKGKRKGESKHCLEGPEGRGNTSRQGSRKVPTPWSWMRPLYSVVQRFILTACDLL